MVMRFSFFLAAAVTCAPLALAESQDPGGNEIGNGGAVVVCQEGDGISATQVVETLDVFESRRTRGLTIDFGNVGKDAIVMARHAISRLRFLDPLREQRLQKRLEEFENEMLFLSDTTFPDTGDTNHFPLPSNCTLKQAVIQRIKQFPEDKKYYINESLWFKLDTPNRAAMILHEIIYEETLRHGHLDSVAARYINSLLFSGMIHKVSDKDYAALMENMGMNRIRWIDPINRAVWELSTDLFAEPSDAGLFCGGINMALIDVKAAMPGLFVNLRQSFIGKYNISTQSSLLVWGAEDEGYTALEISMLYEQLRDPQLQDDLPALCYSPL